jgi:cysteine desulfurase
MTRPAAGRASVYLDWNATTPPRREVVEAMAGAARDAWGNPASVHGHGRAARGLVERARDAVARLARCDARDVVLTSGATEANNLALRSAFDGAATATATAPAGEAARVLVTSRLEHPSVTRVAEALEREGRARVRWVRARPDGTIDLDHLAQACAPGDVRLVAVQAINPETGVIQPVRDAIAIARRAGAWVHVDAVQAFGRRNDVVEEADTRSLAGHKIRGPKSIGALVTRPGFPVAPVVLGGSQERGLRPGTVDPVAAAGLAVAAFHALESPARWRAAAALRDALEVALSRRVPGGRVNGARAPRAPHVSSFVFPGWSAPELVAALDLEGVSVSGGSACSAGTAEASSVLVAMGDDEAARSSVRFSFGEESTAADLDAAIAAVERVLARA